MIEIPLTQGRVAIIDDEDFALVSQYKWYFYKGYAYARVAKKKTRMHRLIMSAPAHLQIDHINGDGLDNTRQNIRLATACQNMANRPKRRASSSPYKGIYWDKKARKWTVEIKCNYKRIKLGRYSDSVDAALAYDHGAIIHAGEYAKVNFPEIALNVDAHKSFKA